MIYLVYATEKNTTKEILVGTYSVGQLAISLALTFARSSDWKNVKVVLKPNKE